MSNYYTLLVVIHAYCLMAHRSWLMPHGSYIFVISITNSTGCSGVLQ